MQLRVTSLPGDGIGPEVMSQALCVLEEVASGFGHDLELDEKEIGGVALEKFGNPLPDATIQACLASQAVLHGAVGSPAFDNNPRELRPEAGLLRLRQELGAFANLRPAVFYPALAACSPLREEVVKGTDILIVRELLGGLYFGQPRSIPRRRPGARHAVNTMRYSEPEIERIARVAFQLARTRRRRLLSVDKSNVLECSRLWREVVTRVGQRFSRRPALPPVRGFGRDVACAQARASSTSSSPRTCLATFCRIRREGSWDRSACWLRPALEGRLAFMSLCMVRLQILLARE